MEFDEQRFLRAVERKREDEGVSWRELARRLDLSASTLSRLARGRKPDLDTFLKLVSWVGEPADRFLAGSSQHQGQGDTLAEVARALDEDPSLSAEDAKAIHEIVHLAYRRLRRA